MPKYTEALKNRNFFFLWLGQIISQVGDRLGQMALIALVYSRAPGSTFEITKIIFFIIIPVFIFGPVAGVYVDRWDRRKTMYLCDILRAIFMLIIPLYLLRCESFIPVYIVTFIVFSIGRFFVPAKFSIIPELVEEKDLLMANSLVNTTGMIAAVLGFGISGILVEWLGAKAGFYLNSLSFVVSAVLIFFIVTKARRSMNLKRVGKEIVEVIRKSVWEELKEGVLYFVRTRDIRLTAGIMFFLWSALGAVGVAMIAFVQDMLKSATLDLGLLAMCLGAGLFLGSILYGKFGSRLSQYKTIFASLFFSGAMLIIFALTINRYPTFTIAALLSFCLGLVISPIMTASYTIIHKSSDNEMMGKIFSHLEIVMHLGLMIFMIISGILAEKYSHAVIIVSAGYLFSALGLVTIFYYRKMPWLD